MTGPAQISHAHLHVPCGDHPGIASGPRAVETPRAQGPSAAASSVPLISTSRQIAAFNPRHPDLS